ncbi:uncharacterized protein LOC135114712 isoform X7 [Scylla paramamosain]|uniref:uncharacterized protein LOC135114712 isoform X7 n=1 Tax=Scylla paramamosain TaxID=85552 RepID=UPI003082E8E0
MRDSTPPCGTMSGRQVGVSLLRWRHARWCSCCLCLLPFQPTFVSASRVSGVEPTRFCDTAAASDEEAAGRNSSLLQGTSTSGIQRASERIVVLQKLQPSCSCRPQCYHHSFLLSARRPYMETSATSSHTRSGDRTVFVF